MFPVRHLAPKILMAINYCGRQLARRLEWAAPAYHKKEGATPHPGASKFCLQYDGRPDWRFWVWVGMRSMGSVSGNGGEVCEEMRKMMIDVCCLQDVISRRHAARMKGRRYKLWWSEIRNGVGSVGVVVKNELCDKMVDIRRVSDRVMTVVVVLEMDVLRLMYGYAPQSGRSLHEKQSFYDEPKGE